MLFEELPNDLIIKPLSFLDNNDISNLNKLSKKINKIFYKNKKIINKSYFHNQPHGYQITFNKTTQTLIVYNYNNGMLHGDMCIYQNNNKTITSYKYGIIEKSLLYNNNTLNRSYYYNNTYVTKYKKWLPNGFNYYEENYKDGLLDGELCMWDEVDGLILHETYIRDKLINTHINIMYI